MGLKFNPLIFSGFESSSSSGGGSGANTTLSNLDSPTAINQPLISDAGNTLDLKTPSDIGDITSNINIITGDDNSSDILDTGNVNISSGYSSSGGSGQLNFNTGNADDTADDGPKVGDINIIPGTPGGNAGGATVRIQVAAGSGTGANGQFIAQAPNVEIDSTISTINLSSATDMVLNSGLTGGSGNITVASIDSNASGSVVLKSGNASGSGELSGGLTVISGDSASGPTGDINIFTGSAADGSTTGNITLQGGIGTPGGKITLTSGDSSSANTNGPDIQLKTGAGAGTGHAGDVDMTLTRVLKCPRHSSDPSGDLIGGSVYYNTTTNKLKVYNGTVWQTITSA